MDSAVFISHTTKDDSFVRRLAATLEQHNITAWTDSHELTAGDKLHEQITTAIKSARYFLVVISQAAMASDWVRAEITFALEQAKIRNDGFKVIPLRKPDVDANALKWMFPEELTHLSLTENNTAFIDLMPALFAALGEQLPNDLALSQTLNAAQIEELVLTLSDPTLTNDDGKIRLRAKAELTFCPSDPNTRDIKSQQYFFEAPIGEIEANDISWYVEEYFRWPTGVFKTRAQTTESDLPRWGKLLYKAALSGESTFAPLSAWQDKTSGRRFSIEVNGATIEGADKELIQTTREAASRLLALPWEIMHDGTGYLNQGINSVHIRRRLPNYQKITPTKATLPIRVLLLSPRPEKTETGEAVCYLDHRSSALPLVQAMEILGEDLVKVDILHPPTFEALKQALKAAKTKNQGYEIVHFDGHGEYDRQVGLGALCFEHPDDKNSLQPRLMQLIHADQLAAELRDCGVPLVYLDACQTAQTEEDPHASVAAKLLEQGVGSVVAMSHSVLVSTAERFVEAFYKALAQGSRVGDAMLAGQAALHDNSYRGKITGAGKLELKDWFVPVLYQEANDPQLFSVQPGESTAPFREKPLEDFPAPPEHGFVGRSYALLQLERLLQQTKYAVIQGSGGMGKTAIATELVRWLVRSDRFGRAVFISVVSQNVQDVKGIIDSIGHQLLPKYAVAEYGNDTKAALQPIERALSDTPTLFLFDNMESVLPDHQGINPAGVADVTELLALCKTLLKQPKTSVIFTSREALPAPFNKAKNNIKLGRLSQFEAIKLVESVMAENDYKPPETDDARTDKDVMDLVNSVNCHPRALVLLAKEVANGVKATTKNLGQLMAELDKRNPNDRENSLYASVELSLRRLPDDVRVLVNKLAVFHDGGSIVNMTKVLGIETEEMSAIVELLINAGMAETMQYGYLRLDPALPTYLKLGQSVETLDELRNLWVDTMGQLVSFLYQQQFKNSTMAAQLTLLELPNLIIFLDRLLLQIKTNNSLAESAIAAAISIEQVMSNLGRAQALAKVVDVREQLVTYLPEWGGTHFKSECLSIERLQQQEQLQLAFKKAQALLTKAKAIGPKAYQGADYNLAMAHVLLSRI